MPSAGFETTIPDCDRRQTHALDRAGSGICIYSSLVNWNVLNGRLCTTTQQTAEHHYPRCNLDDKAEWKVKVYSQVAQAHNTRFKTAS